MSSRGVAPSNNAFAGGAQQRNLYPPGVGGANLSANTSVSAPVAGVAPGQIKSALNNSTSNIGIPYQRCAHAHAHTPKRTPTPTTRWRNTPRDGVHTRWSSQHRRFCAGSCP